LSTLQSFAQQQPLYSQFAFNKFLFNPAVAGSDHTTVIKFSAYEQWVGHKGAPKYHTASFDTRIFQQNRKPRRNIRKRFKLFKPGTLGVGAHLFNEKYGSLSNTGLSLTYSYHMKMDRRQLSFGISPVFSNLGLKSSDIVLSDDLPDAAVIGDNTRRWILDFNFGVYFMDKDYFLGYSIHHISRSAIQWGGTAEIDYNIGRQHYLMGGYKYVINRDYQLEPTLLWKIWEDRKNQFDTSVKLTIKENYWAGLSYKTSNALAVFGGIQIDRYYFCYAFDYHLSEVRKLNYGSHEIILAVQLGDTTKRYRWLNTY
jgi:type IX secretion system PorP/SprF family membrane protein